MKRFSVGSAFIHNTCLSTKHKLLDENEQNQKVGIDRSPLFSGM